MAVGNNSSTIDIINEEEKNADNPNLSPRKRTKDPGVRVKGRRIYDSENGKTCHQCRQKTLDFSASCKRVNNDKPCPLMFCHKCLLNRYGEKAEEVERLEDWMCPRCRGVCNCSCCMKRKGHQPTGILSHTAKATGFNSVEELLHKKGSGVLELQNLKDSVVSPKKSPLSKKDSVALKRKCDKENQSVDQNVSEPKEDGLAKKEKKGSKRVKKCNGSEEAQVSVSGTEARSPKLSEANVLAKCDDNETNKDKENQSVDQNVSEPKEDGLSKKEKKGPKRVKKCNGSEEAQVSVSGTESRSPKLSEANVLAKCDDNETNKDKEHADIMKAKALLKVLKPKKLAIRSRIESKKEDFVMPPGKPLTEIGSLELPSEDIGAALQFLEFCDAFSAVLDIKKGQPECILRDLTRGHTKRLRGHSALIRFNIKLLSLIDTEMKNDGDAWLRTLKSCIEESDCTLGELSIEFLDKGSPGYDNLGPSEKLKILTFLCDEVLATDELRNWIDEAEAKFDEGRKKNKEAVFAARKKEKLIKQKAKDELAKAMLSARGGTPLSLAEFDDILSQIRNEADKVQAEVRASLELVPEKHQRSDAVRTDPLMLGSNGQILWKLSCYNSSSNIILQDIGNWDSISLQDKWFVYNEEEEAVVEKHVSLLRNSTIIKHRSDNAEEVKKSGSSEVSESKDYFPPDEIGA